MTRKIVKLNDRQFYSLCPRRYIWAPLKKSVRILSNSQELKHESYVILKSFPLTFQHLVSGHFQKFSVVPSFEFIFFCTSWNYKEYFQRIPMISVFLWNLFYKEDFLVLTTLFPSIRKTASMLTLKRWPRASNRHYAMMIM